MKNQFTYFLLALFFFIGFFGCKKPPSKSKQEVIQERLDKRLKLWKEGMYRNCRKKAMDASIAIVDSTLLANARLKRDTTDIPSIPLRPDRPEFIPPEDSTPVRQILKTDTTTIQ